MQDFTAPFFTFVKTKYTMQITKAEDDFTETRIELESTANAELFGKQVANYSFRFIVTDSGLQSFIVHHNNKIIKAKCINS